MLHYGILYKTSVVLPRIPIQNKFKILLAVLVALFAHIIEVWIYAYSFFLMHKSDGWGYLDGNYDGSLADSLYFSFTTFSTLGFGDIEPIGSLRFLVGVESLVGFVLITWSASFLYFEMQKYWNE
jgi:hypothetical protein